MYELTVETHFSAAHRLKEYKGKCENLHGHNWKVQVYLKGDKLNKIGMLVDFREIKKRINKIIKKLDHTYLNELEEFAISNPTTENIAKYLFIKLSKENNNDFRMSKVTVWESEDSSVSYEK